MCPWSASAGEIGVSKAWRVGEGFARKGLAAGPGEVRDARNGSWRRSTSCTSPWHEAHFSGDEPTAVVGTQEDSFARQSLTTLLDAQEELKDVMVQIVCKLENLQRSLEMKMPTEKIRSSASRYHQSTSSMGLASASNDMKKCKSIKSQGGDCAKSAGASVSSMSVDMQQQKLYFVQAEEEIGIEGLLGALAKNATAVPEDRAFDKADPMPEGSEIRLPSLGNAKFCAEVPGASSIGASMAAGVRTHPDYVRISVRQQNSAPFQTQQRTPPSDVGSAVAYSLNAAGDQDVGTAGNMPAKLLAPAANALTGRVIPHRTAQRSVFLACTTMPLQVNTAQYAPASCRIAHP
eukprot:Skav234720  [mRNA]  locus=scaffold634:314289:325845:- [translate_table: standard]